MYDLVLSLEVGEHIPEEYEEVFIQNLVTHANDMLVISWGIPGQLGLGHVNCRENSYIIGKIMENGFRYDERWSGILRRTARLPWFKKTLMVFHREKGQG
jgi:tryptophanyl-tRNA synthetase